MVAVWPLRAPCVSFPDLVRASRAAALCVGLPPGPPRPGLPLLYLAPLNAAAAHRVRLPRPVWMVARFRRRAAFEAWLVRQFAARRTTVRFQDPRESTEQRRQNRATILRTARPVLAVGQRDSSSQAFTQHHSLGLGGGGVRVEQACVAYIGRFRRALFAASLSCRDKRLYKLRRVPTLATQSALSQGATTRREGVQHDA